MNRCAILLAVVCAALVVMPSLVTARFTDGLTSSANAFGTDTLDPPTGFGISGTCSLTLSWTATVDSYAAGYRIFRGTSLSGPFSQIATVTPRTTTSYVDSPGNGTYYYSVGSYYQNWDSDGSLASTAVNCDSIALDASSSCTPVDNTSATWSHTTSGANRVLIVGVIIRNSSSETVTSVTYSGVAMSLVAAQSNGTSVRAELWQLVAPQTGAHNIVATIAPGTAMACGAMSFTGVNQTTPIDATNSNTGTSATPTVTVTTVTNHAWLVDTLAFRSSGTPGNPTGTAGSGQTQRWSGYFEADPVRGKGSSEGPQASAGGVVMDWNLSASVDWAIAGAALKPLP